MESQCIFGLILFGKGVLLGDFLSLILKNFISNTTIKIQQIKCHLLKHSQIYLAYRPTKDREPIGWHQVWGILVE